MSAVRQSAQDFADLMERLNAAKPNAATARVLLDEAAAWIHCLISENADVELKLSDAISAGVADCECCDVSYPRAELGNGLCPTCAAQGCDHVRPRIAAEFAGPARETDPAEWQCNRCQLWFSGAGPEGSLCEPCAKLPARAAVPQEECGDSRDGYRCNSDVGHNMMPDFDHAEWRADGTIAARWSPRPAGPDLPDGVVPFLALAPDVAGGS